MWFISARASYPGLVEESLVFCEWSGIEPWLGHDSSGCAPPVTCSSTMMWSMHTQRGYSPDCPELAGGNRRPSQPPGRSFQPHQPMNISQNVTYLCRSPSNPQAAGGLHALSARALACTQKVTQVGCVPDQKAAQCLPFDYHIIRWRGRMCRMKEERVPEMVLLGLG
jgi:hypothetical protein